MNSSRYCNAKKRDIYAYFNKVIYKFIVIFTPITAQITVTKIVTNENNKLTEDVPISLRKREHISKLTTTWAVKNNHPMGNLAYYF